MVEMGEPSVEAVSSPDRAFFPYPQRNYVIGIDGESFGAIIGSEHVGFRLHISITFDLASQCWQVIHGIEGEVIRMLCGDY